MRFRLPAFLENVETPVEGENLLRRFVADPASVGGEETLDLFSLAETGARKNVVVVGIDEVGRGPLAGPVVACAAVLKAPDIMPELNDLEITVVHESRQAIFNSETQQLAVPDGWNANMVAQITPQAHPQKKQA